MIRTAIPRRGRGSVFVPADFLEFGCREAVDVVLHRLIRKGTIRRLARGVYDFPKEHPVLGTLSPSAEDVAMAMAGRDRTRLQPAGAYAANGPGSFRAGAGEGGVPTCAPAYRSCPGGSRSSRRTLQHLSPRLDKSYSLCDAVSFALMKRHSIQDALLCNFEDIFQI